MGLRSFFKPFFGPKTPFASKNAPFAKSKIAAVRQHVCSGRRNGNKEVNPSNGVTCVTGRCTMVMCTQFLGARTKQGG